MWAYCMYVHRCAYRGIEQSECVLHNLEFWLLWYVIMQRKHTVILFAI